MNRDDKYLPTGISRMLDSSVFKSLPGGCSKFIDNENNLCIPRMAKFSWLNMFAAATCILLLRMGSLINLPISC